MELDGVVELKSVIALVWVPALEFTWILELNSVSATDCVLELDEISETGCAPELS